MGGRTTERLSFMKRIKDWERCNLLACHNYWPVALYHVENEDFEAAVQILEVQLVKGATDSKSMLDMVDCSSLLWRLNLCNPSSFRGKQIPQRIADICSIHSNKHVTTFNDAHIMMSFNTEGDPFKSSSLATELLETYSSKHGELVDHPTVGSKILQAFIEYRDEKYVKVVELLEQIRGEHIKSLGGSNAQRDLFNLMLIISALKSTNPRHKKLARVLINERDCLMDIVLNNKACSLIRRSLRETFNIRLHVSVMTKECMVNGKGCKIRIKLFLFHNVSYQKDKKLYRNGIKAILSYQSNRKENQYVMNCTSICE